MFNTNEVPRETIHNHCAEFSSRFTLSKKQLIASNHKQFIWLVRFVKLELITLFINLIAFIFFKLVFWSFRLAYENEKSNDSMLKFPSSEK